MRLRTASGSVLRVRPWVLGGLVTGLILTLVAGCDGEGAGPPPDPWGLTTIELPGTVEEIAAVYDSMPAEVAGFRRVGELGGEHLIDYGGEAQNGPMLWNQDGGYRVVDGRQLPPGEFLSYMAGTGELNIVGSVLDGDVVWVHVTDQAADESGEWTEHLVAVGEAEGDYLFFFSARSEAHLNAAIEAFVETVEG